VAELLQDPAPKARVRAIDAPSAPIQPARRGVTVRSVLLGSLIAALICWITPYNDYVVANTFLVGGYLPLAMVLVFFTIAVLVNPLLIRLSPRLGLTTPELAVVLTMTLVSCAIPSQGLLRAFIPQLVAPFYHGRGSAPFWNAFAGMNLPGWLFPVPSIAEVRNSPIVMDFYGSVPPGRADPVRRVDCSAAGVGRFRCRIDGVAGLAGVAAARAVGTERSGCRFRSRSSRCR
jgi:hypothetical protein